MIPTSHDSARSDAARQRAEVYAPRPTRSLATYAFASGSTVLVILLTVFGFYQIDLVAYPLGLLTLVIGAAAAGAIVHMWRSGRHAYAHNREHHREPMTSDL